MQTWKYWPSNNIFQWLLIALRINPLYVPPNQHYRLLTCPVSFHSILLHRGTLLLPNSSTLCYSYPGILSNPPKQFSPATVFAHADATSRDLSNFFLQTWRQSINLLHHLIESCTHAPPLHRAPLQFIIWVDICLISVPSPSPITSTTRIWVLERRYYLCVCFYYIAIT